MDKLRQRAARHGRPVDAELLHIVRGALMAPEGGSAADFVQLAADIRALSDGRRQTPSEELLGEGRGGG
jgi:plasmid stability protein